MYLQVLQCFAVGYAFLCPRGRGHWQGPGLVIRWSVWWKNNTALCGSFSAQLCSAGTPWGRDCLTLCNCKMHLDGFALHWGCWKMPWRGKRSNSFLWLWQIRCTAVVLPQVGQVYALTTLPFSDTHQQINPAWQKWMLNLSKRWFSSTVLPFSTALYGLNLPNLGLGLSFGKGSGKFPGEEQVLFCPIFTNMQVYIKSTLSMWERSTLKAK